MNGKFDIVGLTLAEIALVVLFSFLAVSMPNEDQQELATTKTRLEQENSQLKNKNRQLADEIAKRDAEARNAAPRPGLKSAQTPTCKELGISSSWLFEGEIVGRDEYKVNERVVTAPELFEIYSNQLNVALRRGCMETIRMKYPTWLSAGEVQEAYKILETKFYVKKEPVADAR